MTKSAKPPLNVIFAGRPSHRDEWGPHLHAEIDRQGLNVNLVMDPAELAPDQVDAMIYAPVGEISDFTPFTRLKAVFNLWAGVETIVGNDTLNVPLCRMVEPGLTEGMTDYVLAHVMRHHIEMDRHLAEQSGSAWLDDLYPKLSRQRKVTVLGMGELGQDAAIHLAACRFDVTGWSRRPKIVEGIRCEYGEAGLARALSDAEIVVLLLPNTPATENILNTQTLGLMAKGACIVNPGRGTLINDDDLLSALDSGQIRHATLDVFRTEPLPADDPYWAHPSVTVTPHIASVTRADTASAAVVEQIGRLIAGEPLLHIVDRAQGY